MEAAGEEESREETKKAKKVKKEKKEKKEKKSKKTVAAAPLTVDALLESVGVCHLKSWLDEMGVESIEDISFMTEEELVEHGLEEDKAKELIAGSKN